jgi:hypothetical protein
MPYLPLDSEIVDDPALRPQTLHDYTRLLWRAWQGRTPGAGSERPLETRLTLADLQALFGHADRPLAASNVYRRMGELKAHRLVEWAIRRGEYVFTFPRATLDPQEWAQAVAPTRQELAPKKQECAPTQQEPNYAATPDNRECAPEKQECGPAATPEIQEPTPKKQECNPNHREPAPKNQEPAYVKLSAPDPLA